MIEKGLEIKSMHIKYVFTEDEKKEIASKLAAKTSEKQALEDRKKEVTSQLAGEINGAAAAISRYSKEYNQGYTWKNHDCYEIFDYDKKEVYTYRADTDEMVGTRTMTSIEFQREIFDPREEIQDAGDSVVKEFSDELEKEKDIDPINDTIMKDETLEKISKKGAK